MIRIWFEDTYNPGWYWEEGNEKFGPFFSAESAIKDYLDNREELDTGIEQIAKETGTLEEI